MRIIKTIIYLSFALLIAGCASKTYHVDVDSICMSAAKQKKKYVILPGNKDCKITDLQFEEFAAYSEKALESKGFVKSSDIDDAEIAIVLCYGISDPQFFQYTYSVPIWGQTGISSSNTSGTVNSFGNGVTYSQNTSYTPSYGIVGSSTKVGTDIYYVRYLILSGYDLEKFKRTKKIEDAQEIWSTKVNSVGQLGDLRKIFPVLLVASQKHLAENTEHKVSYDIDDNKKLAEKINQLKKNEK